MNAKIAAQKKLKAKLGVTMTPNMGVKGIIEAWGRVPPQIKSALPAGIDFAMTTAQTTYGVLLNEPLGLRPLYTKARTTYDTCAAAIEAGVATLGGQPQQPAILAASTAAKGAEQQVDTQVQGLGTQLLNTVTTHLG